MIGGRNWSQLLIVCVSAIIYQMPGAEAMVAEFYKIGLDALAALMAQ